MEEMYPETKETVHVVTSPESRMRRVLMRLAGRLNSFVQVVRPQSDQSEPEVVIAAISDSARRISPTLPSKAPFIPEDVHRAASLFGTTDATLPLVPETAFGNRLEVDLPFPQGMSTLRIPKLPQ